MEFKKRVLSNDKKIIAAEKKEIVSLKSISKTMSIVWFLACLSVVLNVLTFIEVASMANSTVEQFVVSCESTLK